MLLARISCCCYYCSYYYPSFQINHFVMVLVHKLFFVSFLSLSLSRMCSPISGGAGQASVPSSLPPLTSSQPAHLLAINSSNSKGKDRERPPLLPGCCHSCAFCYLIMLSRVCAQTNLQIKKDSDWGASLVHSVEQLSHML